jgi:hypothetical protein
MKKKYRLLELSCASDPFCLASYPAFLQESKTYFI